MQALVQLQGACYSVAKREGMFRHSRTNILHELDISIQAGESVAVIGVNGSGKTTLLRLIAGIFQATSGSITNRASTTSLLSIGVGFVSQLTGRENVILSGILLGFTKRQVETHISEIREFSGLGEAFEDALSTYSSGMRARLGFSISAMLEPDLLLIDEVLAVGDKDFVEKSMAIMERKFKSSHTVLVVSHNLEQIRKMCERAIWIDRGRCVLDGPVDEVISAYLDAPNRLSK